jgi:hypothetical protein
MSSIDSSMHTDNHLASSSQVHLGSNYAAMKVLALRSINRSRLDVLLQDYLALPTGADKAGMSDKRFSPAGVGPREVVLPWLVALSPLNLFRRKHKVRKCQSEWSAALFTISQPV